MIVRLAEHAGFCFGVKKAILLAEESLNEPRKWYTLGPLVHNKNVVEDLRKKGLSTVSTTDEIIDSQAGVVIRSHGVANQVIMDLKNKGVKIIDATCPRVKYIQNLVLSLSTDNYDIVIFGDENHPEIIGIRGWCAGNSHVVSSTTDLESLKLKKKVALVSQTTKNINDYNEVANALLKNYHELRVFNTICNSTKKRQEASYQLSKNVDVMLVIGDKESSNTKTLTKECLSTGVRTYQIESINDISNNWFDNDVCAVGVTAGASTPDWIIKEVIDKMTNMDEKGAHGMENEINLESSEQSVSAEVLDEGLVQDNSQQEESFAKMEAEMADLTSPSKGDIVTGKVIQVLDDEVMVDVGGKSEGIIPLRELSLKDISSAKDLVNIGDEIEVLVLKWDDDGNILLSKKRVDSQKFMDKLEESYNNGETIEGHITGTVKGGLLVDVGVTAFIPASHIDDSFIKNLDDFIGKTMQFKIIEFNRNKRRGSQVVLSRKEIMAGEKAKLKKEFWENISEDQVKTGRIKRIVDYGAFIDLGGYEGLLHVSEIDHHRIEHPAEVFSEGDEIDVYILGLDREKERVSLSRKKMLKSPWEVLSEQYDEGDIIEGTVVRLTSFGAFVELAPGVDGLIHISQLANYRVEKPEEVVTIGEKVATKILGLNKEEKKISLSLKEANNVREQAEIDDYIDNQDM